MEPITEINQSICPACRKPNLCEMANKQDELSSYSDDPNFSCWCLREKSIAQWRGDMSGAVKTIVPNKTDRTVSCFCHECLPCK
jgi:hypothetical protein